MRNKDGSANVLHMLVGNEKMEAREQELRFDFIINRYPPPWSKGEEHETMCEIWASNDQRVCRIEASRGVIGEIVKAIIDSVNLRAVMPTSQTPAPSPGAGPSSPSTPGRCP